MSDSTSIRYLTSEEALQLHVEIMEATGSESQGLRSFDGLSSALNRAPAAAHYLGIDLIGQSARLATGLSRSQAFVEGNKRTAYAVSTIFLDLNGYEFVGDPVAFSQQLDGLADSSVTDDDADMRFEEWLRERVAPRTLS